METQFVFHDPTGRRWQRIRRGLQISGLALIGLTLLLSLTIFSSPQLPVLGLPSVEHLGNYKEVPSILGGERSGKNVPFKVDRRNIKYVRSPNPVIHPRNAAAVVEEQPVVFGFYVNWDPASLTSLRANLQHLTHLVPEWFTLLNGRGDLGDESDAQVIRICHDAHLPILGMVTNFRDGWQAGDLHQLLNNPTARKDIIENIVSNAKEHELAGMTIDFEEASRSDRKHLSTFMQELKTRFDSEHLMLAEAVPADDNAYDLKALAAAVDYIVPMVYDEHYQSGEPGPIASEDWFEKQLDRLGKILPREKTVVGIGNYGYDWVIGGSAATELSFQKIMSAANANKAAVEWDATMQNPVLRYTSQTKKEKHEIWFLDAVTALNQIQSVSQEDFRGIGVWRLGGEDSDMWNTLAGRKWPDEHFGTVALETMSSLKIVDRNGDGDILRVVDTPHDGKRSVRQEQDGDYAERYERYPSYYVIEANGPAAGEGKQLVLTFDDGPDPTWTPQILDVLKNKHVPGTFFVIGVNAESSPDLVRRIYSQGDLIGNHTYDHPNIATISAQRMFYELNLTQRLIEHDTGHATTLFRPPYNADSEPATAEEVEPIWHAEKDFGYTMIGERIDPQDWKPGITAKQIIDEVISEKDNGHIILLHDGGGDRSATLEALPVLIDQLRSAGYQFVNVDSLMNKSRDQLMPVPSEDERRMAGLEGSALVTKSNFKKLVGLLFLAAIYLTVARSLVFGAMAVTQKLRLRLRTFKTNYAPPVSVIVAAYNEDKVITKTVDSLLASNYPDFEVIVVDDGSKDRTLAVLQQRYEKNPRVRIFTQHNGGKSSALNHAIRESSYELLVALDADTVFEPDTIRNLIRHFVSPKVGAVSGNAKVGNRHNWITRFQSIEYVCGFNLDRRALDLLNAITVVPGAVGAWRKDLVLEVGGFGHETLAEDTDVTLAIRRLGYEIRYEEAAIAHTEAPETTRALAKQRFRWAFGTLQAAWKHRDALFLPRYGALAFVALPSIWVFQVVLALLSPLAEIAMVIALIAGNWEIVLLYYLAFFAIDLLTAVLAYGLEEERPSDLVLFFPQRLYFRALMNFVLAKSFVFALRGRLVGWGKLERTARVHNAA
jgi:peptidoglycan-N-acetylglucosamine deacetylase